MAKINKNILYSFFQFYRIKPYLSQGYYYFDSEKGLCKSEQKTNHRIKNNGNPSVESIRFGGFKKVFVFYDGSDYVRVFFYSRKQINTIINTYQIMNYPLLKIVKYNHANKFLDLERVTMTPRDYSFSFSYDVCNLINMLTIKNIPLRIINYSKKNSIAYKIGIHNYYTQPQHGDLHNGNIIVENNKYKFIDLDYIGYAPLFTDQISLFTSCTKSDKGFDTFVSKSFIDECKLDELEDYNHILGKYMILFLLHRLKKSILYGSSLKSIRYDFSIYSNCFFSYKFTDYPYVKEGLLLLEKLMKKRKLFIYNHLL